MIYETIAIGIYFYFIVFPYDLITNFFENRFILFKRIEYLPDSIKQVHSEISLRNSGSNKQAKEESCKSSFVKNKSTFVV